jgi:16S rRNA (adenine1518-N6/adenine1519-N6)-dimethyltransferase
LIALRTKTDIVAALRERGIRLKKSLGQNLLIDHNLLGLIVRSAGVGKTDLVLEIGSGSGLLTHHLAEAAARVVTVEVDSALADLCRDYTADLDNVTLLNCDILKSKAKLNPHVEVAVLEVMESAGITRLKVVGNLPYRISTIVIPLLLEGPLPVVLMVCLVQKEVSDRLAASPGTKDYGALSVIVQAHARVEELRVLKPAVFFPEPKVSSAIVRLTPRHDILRRIRDYDTFSRLTRSLFLHRRKKVMGALRLAEPSPTDRRKLAFALDRAGIDEQARADQLAVEQIVRLANEIASEPSQ